MIFKGSFHFYCFNFRSANVATGQEGISQGRSYGLRPMTAIELLGQAQALQHDPSNSSSNLNRQQKLKGAGNGSRPQSPAQKSVSSSDPVDFRQNDDLNQAKTKFENSVSVVSTALSSATKRYHPYPSRQDSQIFPLGQFVLPEKVLSGPVSTTPRIRPSASNIHSSAFSMGESFQGKPVLIGNLDAIPSVTSVKEDVKASSLPEQPFAATTTTQSYTYAMSVTGRYS